MPTLQTEYSNLMGEARSELRKLHSMVPSGMKDAYASEFLRHHRALEDLVRYAPGSGPPCAITATEAEELMKKWCGEFTQSREWVAHISIRAAIARSYAVTFRRLTKRMHRLARRLAAYNSETTARQLEAEYLAWKAAGAETSGDAK